MDKLSVAATARDQARIAASGRAGRAAHTLYGGHDKMLRQTVIALTAGSALADHESPGEATLLVLGGQVRLATVDGPGDALDGAEGDLLVVPAARHRLDALTDATVLLTVAKHL